MSDQEKTLLKELQTAMIKYIVGMVGTALIVAVGFYFSTNYRMAAIEDKMENKMDKEPMQTVVKNIESSLNSIKTDIKEIRNTKEK